MIRCLLVDDEPLALELLIHYLRQIPDVEVVGACLSTFEAEKIRFSTPVDLILLDINMPDRSGMEYARTLTEPIPYIIFTTAYSEYAVEGFKVEAIDYLLKPIDFNALQAAIERVKKRLKTNASADETLKKHIFVKSNGKTWKIDTDDISHVMGMGEYVRIELRKEPYKLVTLSSMHAMEELLPPDKFMRVHKSHIINLADIEAYDSSSVTLGGESIPLSLTYRPSFQKWAKTSRK